jgi:hypothetical protein
MDMFGAGVSKLLNRMQASNLIDALFEQIRSYERKRAHGESIPAAGACAVMSAVANRACLNRKPTPGASTS